jgi:single-strand DNA-binding protein
MNQLNLILIEGNLTRDAELKYTSGGSPVCSFSIASNRSYKKGEVWEKEVSYYDIETWAKLAENCAQLKKGSGVRVVGRLKQERWTDADGKARSKVKVVAEHVEFMPVNSQGQNPRVSSPPAQGEDFTDDIPW